MIIHQVPTTPKARRTLAELDAPDPWHGGQPTHFSLIEFDMVSVATDRPFGARVVGLRSARNGEERLIPEALYELWRSGEVREEQLPQRLHDFGTRFGPKDAELILGTYRHRVALVGFLTVALLFAGAGGWLYWLVYKPGTHVVQQIPTGQLGTRPQRDREAVWTMEQPPVLDAATVEVLLPVVPHLITHDVPTLEVVQEGPAQRLVLSASPRMRFAIPMGITWRTDELGPNVLATVAQLAEKYPGLERDHVLCQMWAWDDGYATLPGWFLLGIAAIFAGLGIATWAIVARRLSTRRAQLAWIRGGLTGTGAGGPPGPRR